jgi:hypothetical protein
MSPEEKFTYLRKRFEEREKHNKRLWLIAWAAGIGIVIFYFVMLYAMIRMIFER